MLKNVNLPCIYSSNHLRFQDGTDFSGFTPGIRGRSRFVVKIIEDDGNFKIPGSDYFGDPARYTKCRIQGHYADKPEDQLVSLYCDDLGPLAGIDQKPERIEVVANELAKSDFNVYAETPLENYVEEAANSVIINPRAVSVNMGSLGELSFPSGTKHLEYDSNTMKRKLISSIYGAFGGLPAQNAQPSKYFYTITTPKSGSPAFVLKIDSGEKNVFTKILPMEMAQKPEGLVSVNIRKDEIDDAMNEFLYGRRMPSNESENSDSRSLVVEKAERKTIQTFVYYLMDHNCVAQMDGGEMIFYVKKLNDENFDFEDTPKFLQQIKDENLYDRVYVAGICNVDTVEKHGGKIPAVHLPIYGRSDKYVTKWLQNKTLYDAVEEELRINGKWIKNRIEYFKVPEENRLQLKDLQDMLMAANLPAYIRMSRKGDVLETTVDFSKEECDKWKEIPTSSGYILVLLKNNKYVINGHKYGSAKKAFDDIIAMRDSRLEESIEIIKSFGMTVKEA